MLSHCIMVSVDNVGPVKKLPPHHLYPLALDSISSLIEQSKQTSSSLMKFNGLKQLRI